jgi:outer membrane receptor protein involved in Fe transport
MDVATMRIARAAVAARCVALCAFLALACAQMARAQGATLQGVVQDSSGAAIPGAQVHLSTNSYSAQTVTDSSGTFSFDRVPDSSGTVTVTAKGFQQVDQKWSAATGAATHLTVSLQPLALNQQVIVTAARTTTRLSDSPVSDIELTRQDLQETPALTLDDSLRQVPGFSLFRRSSSRIANPTTLGVSLRGLGSGSGSSRALVLEDGVPLNDPFGSWVYWDRVPSASIASVEVAQEGASSLYGSEALSGVIQFLTRPPVPAGLSIDASYGNQNTPNLSLWAGGEKDGWFSTFGGEVFHTDGYFLVPAQDRGSIDTMANSEHGTADLTVGRKFGAGDQIFARGLYFDDSRNNGTPYQTNSIRMGQGVLGADLNLGSIGTLTLRSYGDFETYHQGFSSVGAGRNSETPTDKQTVPAQGIGVSAVWTRAVGARQTLVAGFDEHEELGHSDEILFSAKKDTVAGGHQRTVGVFGEDIIQLAPRWLLSVSGRYDHWSNFDASLFTNPFTPPPPASTLAYANRSYDVFDPRATLVHQFNEHVSWSTAVYRAFRAPTLNELYRSFRQGTTTTDANPNLKAERLTGVESGVDVHTLSQRLELRGVFFYNQVINPVSNVPCSGPNMPPPCVLASSGSTQVRENLGRTSAPGFEIDGVANITRHIQLSTGYQYVNAKILSTPGLTPSLANTWVAQVPHHDLTFQAVYANPRIITVSFDGRMVGKQYDSTSNQFLMGGYFLLDAMASRSIGEGVQVYFAAENLLDRGYLFSLNGGPELGLPITARFGIRFNLPER